MRLKNDPITGRYVVKLLSYLLNKLSKKGTESYYSEMVLIIRFCFKGLSSLLQVIRTNGINKAKGNVFLLFTSAKVIELNHNYNLRGEINCFN